MPSPLLSSCRKQHLSMFKTSLTDRDEFTVTYELVPGQGSGGKQVDRLLDFARQAQADGRIKALSVTDNPGGNPALAPVAIGSELLRIGIEPLIHFSLKDKNRNQVVSHIFLYQRLQMHSLLVLGGDFPRPGYYGQAKPVFDLDTIQTLQLMHDLEQGSYHRKSRKRSNELPPPALFKGCVVSPFKTSEAEQVWQYAKLLHKVRAGADFIITQLGFDLDKFSELMTFLRQHDIKLPVLANVFIPSLPVARAMATGRVPGILLADELLAAIEAEEASGDKESRLRRAAAMIVKVKALGCRGVHLGGNNLNFEDLRSVLDRVEQQEKDTAVSAAACHYPVAGSWYLYPHTQTTAESPQPVPLHPGTRQGSAGIHGLSHDLLFSKKTVSGRAFGSFCRFCARGRYRTIFLYTVERCIKRLLFNCRMCGDCTLENSAYLCPQSGCPKRLVNGPCGGSRRGFCEVFPQRRCFWVRVYGRLAPNSSIQSLTRQPSLPPKDWAMEKSSSWINYFQEKDR